MPADKVKLASYSLGAESSDETTISAVAKLIQRHPDSGTAVCDFDGSFKIFLPARGKQRRVWLNIRYLLSRPERLETLISTRSGRRLARWLLNFAASGIAIDMR